MIVFSIRHNLKLPEKNLMRDCLDQVGQWSCLWGIALITLCNMEQHSLKVGDSIPVWGSWTVQE